MTGAKDDVLDMLRELAELTLLDEGDPQSFRVRAYESAIAGVQGYAGELERQSVKALQQQIEGVGKGIAEKIHELLATGRVTKLQTLRERYPAPLVALLRVPGLGPKAVRRLHADLGVSSLDDLRRALAAHALRDAKGFGPKSEAKLTQTLSRLDQQGHGERTPISVALPLGNRIVAELQRVPGVSHASYCGSLRRFCETVGDIDVVVVASDARAVMQAVTGMRSVERVLVSGPSKTSVVTRRGTQVDVRVVAAHQLGAAQLYFTGSKGHNIKLRQRALARGYSLNEYALTELDSRRIVASETEADIYAALGLPFIPPELREDAGEIEAAESGTLPAPFGAIIGDFHVHTSVSGDSRAALEHVVAAAKARGYRALAITDHAEGTAPGVGRDALLAQRDKIRVLQRELGAGLSLLHGVELNIGPEGELDYDDAFRRSFDFCLASVHDHFELPAAAQTRRVVRAMQDPSVRMIGHLSARMIGSRPPIALELEAVFTAAEATGTALEINGSLPRLDLSTEALRHARERKLQLVLTSDAHRVEELERVSYAALCARKAWIDPGQIVNTAAPDALLAWTRGKQPAA